MKASKLAAIVLFCLLQAACVTPSSKTPQSLASSTSPQITTLPFANQREPLTPAQADEMMASVVAAINQNRSEVLVPYMLPRDQEIENVRAAIEDFQTYFQSEPIQRFERQPSAEVYRFNYRVFNPSGISKLISITQDANFEPAIRLIDEFFLYSRWAKSLAERYHTALKTKDVNQLARVLSSDDFPYPIAGATQVIDTYTARFDLATLEVKFVRLEAEQSQFIYRITGTKNGKPVAHWIGVVYGDGLVSLVDKFLPDRLTVVPQSPLKCS